MMWIVKVYQEASQSYTHISMEADSEDDCRQELEDSYRDPKSWVFVSAEEDMQE